MKKSKLFIRRLVLLMFLICATLSIHASVQIDGLYYDLNSSTRTATLTYQSKDADNANYVSGDVTIPETVTYAGQSYTVTSIGEYAFVYCDRLTSVTIPESVTSIGKEAFNRCDGLTKAEFASIESLCKIQFGGFFANPLIKANHLWIDNEEITDLIIPESVTSIGDMAFEFCDGLTSVTIPNSVTEIGEYAFNCCIGLTSVTIPDSITSIKQAAFANCEGLTSVTIPESVTEIVAYAFSGCTGLTEVTIPDSVTEIGEYAFNRCHELTSVTIPNSVTEIGDYAFYGCSGLTSVFYGAAEPINGDSSIFDDDTYSNATLYMSEEGAEIGKTIDPWKNFEKLCVRAAQ